MKSLIGLFLIGALLSVVNAQQIQLEAGQTISKFNYINSTGTTLDNLQSQNYTYLRLGYRNNIFRQRVHGSALLSYNGYGTNGSDLVLDNFFAWDLNYMGLNLGLEYEFWRPGDFTFFIRGEGSIEFLVRGTLKVNNQVYKLNGNDDFNTPIYTLRAGLGVQYKVTEKVSVFTQYSYGQGTPFQIERGQLSIDIHNIGFGVLIHLFPAESATEGLVSSQITQYRRDLNESLKRVNELEKEVGKVEALENEVKKKDAEMKVLRDTLAGVLFDFSERGFEANLKNNKIYVTLENDMLFESGSWKVGSEGIVTINSLGNALAENPDVTVLIEGHTDNQPYRGKGEIESNWDLSTKRAVAIVDVLSKNPKIDPRNLTAAGKGEYSPIASNLTKDGRARNRRIEVIITPNLDQAYNLLKN